MVTRFGNKWTRDGLCETKREQKQKIIILSQVSTNQNLKETP